MTPHRIPSLDGIRCLAFLLVFLEHAGLERVIPGGLGVTIFFVLSGYLITSLLQAEFRAQGRIDLRNFYWRRALRILPPLLITLALAVLLHQVAPPPERILPKALLALSAFAGNYYLFFTHNAGIPQGQGVLWSLAIEEHYYLLFPPLLIWLLRKDDRRLTMSVLTAICLGVLAIRFFLWYGLHMEWRYLYSATESRADSLLFGAGLALLAPRDAAVAERGVSRRDLILLALGLGLLLATLAIRNPTFKATLRYSLQCLALVPLLWLAVNRSSLPGLRLLNHPWMIRIGVYSYALYLVHLSIYLCLERRFPGLPTAGYAVAAFAASYAYAYALHRFVEVPLRRRAHSRVTPAAAMNSG